MSLFIKFKGLLNRMKKQFLFLVMILISVYLISCSKDKSSNEEVNTGTPVKVTHPFITDISDSLELNGNVVFLRKEVVRATFQGYIEKEFKNIGDNIKAGEPLFVLRTMESAAAESLHISIGDAQFKGTIKIMATTDGVLTELNYHNGSFVSSGEQIAIISNPSSIRIKVNVPFEDVSKVKIESRCNIILPGGERLVGIIEKKLPSVDSVTQTQTYFIKLSGNKTLPEHLNITVKIPFNKFNNALVIPKNSIVTNVTQDSFWVMKLINDTTAVRVNIRTGIKNDSIVQVQNSALNPKDRIITSGAYGLPDSAKVEIEK